ncbi:MAG: hypothetical protein Q7S95_03635 [bacterium]|nr:hypothetical protein [bacterium]
MKKILPIVALVLVVAAGSYVYLSKSGSGESVVPPTTQFFGSDHILSTDTVIQITDKGFEPSDISIKKGKRVVFINETSDWAWPASDPHPTHTEYSGFDPQEPFKNGEAWAFTFDRVGDFTFHNHLEPNRRGIIHVTE